MKEKRVRIPANEQIKRLLVEAAAYDDHRALPAVCLLLSNALSVERLTRLEWANWDRSGKRLVIPRGRSPIVNIAVSVLMESLLNAIPQHGSRQIFGSTNLAAPSLRVLFTHILIRSGLESYVVADLLAWSEIQTPAVRLSTATT